MTAQEILEKAFPLMEKRMTRLAYATFVHNQLQAHGLYGNILLLKISTPVFRDQVMERFAEVQTSVREAADDPELQVELVLCDEADARGRELSEGVSDDPEATLNPAYTFENYVQGDNNFMAYAVSVAVAEKPGMDFNPLFIYGGTGLGKTHLMQAIGHYAHEIHPELNICYITSENFINQLVSALQKHESDGFRERFRHVDLLLMDDIQFIAGKTSTETEFFHTFNDLKQNGKGIVMVSDKPPREIQNLEERLCSRFEGGMVIDIQKPDYETRHAILRKKAEVMELAVDDDILKLIAEHVDSNVREMEGCLTRLSAHMRLSGRKIDVSEAERLLADVFRRHEHRAVSVEHIQKTVAHYFGISVDDLVGVRRNREFNTPRQIAMYLCRELLSQPYTMIGAEFTKRHHSTVMNAVENVEKQLREQPQYVSVMDDIRRMIDGR